MTKRSKKKQQQPQREKLKLQVGDFVVAKVKGWSFWPARVVELNSTGKWKYWVRFFGTNELNLHCCDFKLFSDLTEAELASTKKGFQEAVEQCRKEIAKTQPQAHGHITSGDDDKDECSSSNELEIDTQQDSPGPKQEEHEPEKDVFTSKRRRGLKRQKLEKERDKIVKDRQELEKKHLENEKGHRESKKESQEFENDKELVNEHQELKEKHREPKREPGRRRREIKRERQLLEREDPEPGEVHQEQKEEHQEPKQEQEQRETELEQEQLEPEKEQQEPESEQVIQQPEQEQRQPEQEPITTTTTTPINITTTINNETLVEASVDCSLNDLTSEQANADRGNKNLSRSLNLTTTIISKQPEINEDANEEQIIAKLKMKVQEKLNQKEALKRVRVEKKKYEKVSKILPKFTTMFKHLHDTSLRTLKNPENKKDAKNFRICTKQCEGGFDLLKKCLTIMMNNYDQKQAEFLQFHDLLATTVQSVKEVKQLRSPLTLTVSRAFIKTMRSYDTIKEFINGYNDETVTKLKRSKEETIIESKENPRKRRKIVC